MMPAPDEKQGRLRCKFTVLNGPCSFHCTQTQNFSFRLKVWKNRPPRVQRSLKGNISISGKLVVGSSGNIEGNVICQNADISGEIHGKVTVSELLSLKASAKLLGDIVTGKISIEPNATFTGTCNMGAVVKNITNASEKREAATQTA